MNYLPLVIVLGVLALLLLLFLILPPFILYRVLLVRTKKEKWGRECSKTTDAEQVKMFDDGKKWIAEYQNSMTDVEINNEGFHLVGKYFDFGAKKAVIVIAGRSESCLYSCYFTEPYRKAGYNVLVTDNRCHGLSDGKYNNVGYKEYTDILAWGKFLKEEKGNTTIICHGICIGSATALYALCTPDCPEYMKGIVADGMFTRFRDSFNNNLKKRHVPRFPTTIIMMALITAHSGCNAMKDGPIIRIKNYKRPILFLYSKQDKFSRPENARALYETCEAPKKLVWFEKGVHSHIRINAVEKYDETICQWLDETFPNE